MEDYSCNDDDDDVRTKLYSEEGCYFGMVFFSL